MVDAISRYLNINEKTLHIRLNQPLSEIWAKFENKIFKEKAKKNI